jgi:exonuclease III
MIKIASINLNKRLGNPLARQAFEKWLDANSIDLVLAQEPWTRGKSESVSLRFFDDLGGNDGVRVWLRRKWKNIPVNNIKENWQEICLDYLTIYNVYLSAYDSLVRAKFINKLAEAVADKKLRPVLIVGDFNLAPTPLDGVIGNQISGFTEPQERIAFETLLKTGNMIDGTFKSDSAVEYTIEREIAGKLSRFRCDLALYSKYLGDEIKVGYDHSVRNGVGKFTDHSALVINLPVDIPAGGNEPLELFEDVGSQHDASSWQYEPYKTAMSRSDPSSVAKMIVNSQFIPQKSNRILDFGCGRGADLTFYSGIGFDAEGWDPHKPFGFSVRPNGLFDLVTCVFVLNVLPNPFERLAALADALTFVRKEGLLVVATRSPEAIESEGIEKKWKRHNDGFWSSEARATFQKGIGLNEIARLLERLERGVNPDTTRLAPIKDTVVVIS